MRFLTILLLASIHCASMGQHNNTTIDLFDGKSLNGWEYFLVDQDLKMEDVWSVEDGLLVCKGEPMGYLATHEEFTNFKLVVEWRWAPGKEAGNSGVLMRITGNPQALPKCTEAQLKHGSAGDIYGFHGFKVSGDPDRYIENEKELTGKLTGVSKIKDNEKAPGEWNQYEIYMLKGNLTLYVNGEKVNEANGLDIHPGKIGFQSEGGEIHFRTISIIPLDPKMHHGHLHEHNIGLKNWPQFHGPDRNNRSTEKGLLEEWPDGGPKLLWTSNGLGNGYSTVSIANGTIYTAGNIDEKTVVAAFNMQGEKIWATVNGIAWEDGYPGSRSTPTVDGDRLYHQSPLGSLSCMNAKTGEIIWQKNVLDAFNSKTNKWAMAESVLIDGDNVISTPGGPEVSMIALNKMTGELVWKAESINDLAGYSSPILINHKGIRILVNLTAKAFIGVNADNGNLLWNVKHKSYADENVLMPIYKDGGLFVSTLKAGSVKWKINVEGENVSLEELWRSKDMDNHHGDVALIDGYLYGTSTFKNGNKWVCLDWETGETKYVTAGTGKSSLTYVDEKLYTLSIKGLVGLVNPTPEVFEVISTFQIPKGGEGPSWAHPVVCDGKLYIRHGEFLYAYSVR